MIDFESREFKLCDINNDYINMLNYSNNIYSRHQNKKHTKENCSIYFKERIKNKDIFLIHLDSKNNKIIGTTCAMNLENRKYNLGIMIHYKYRNKGIGKMVWIRAIEDLVNRGSMQVYAGTHVKNRSMLKILEETMIKIKSADTNESVQFKLNHD